MPTHDANFLYLLNASDHFESFARYAPETRDFHDYVRPRLPSTWEITRSGEIWFQCSPPSHSPPRQGWKIHLSSTPEGAHSVLAAVIPEFVESKTTFKFVLDYFVFFITNGKNWPRAASGKFVTAYPNSEAEFTELLERCHGRTLGMRGPHILSDRPYRDSRVVFYRYGQFVAPAAVNVNGHLDTFLRTPDGGSIPDVRLPYFTKPTWVEDPVATPAAPAQPPSKEFSSTESSITLNGGAYVIDDALTFRNTGGVYRGTDVISGRQIICKEARPDLHLSPDGIDAVAILRKEYKLLKAVEPFGIAPKPVELFQDWEHWFLVEEFVPGFTLSAYTARECPFWLTAPSENSLAAFYDAFRCIFAQVCDHLKMTRKCGIAVVDLSLTNVMFDPDTKCARLIDLDAACQLGVDPPRNVGTIGFAPRNRWSSSWTPSYEDDLYGLGALMLAFLVRINPMLGINFHAAERFLGALARDFRLPSPIAETILALMDEDPGSRPHLSAVRRQIDAISFAPTPSSFGCDFTRRSAEEEMATPDVSRFTIDYIESVADYERSDRLFPADPRVFQTNPLSVAYGASGIAYAFHRVRGSVPDAAVAWMLDRLREDRDYPPGLYVGLSGVSWVLYELGATEEAENILKRTHHDERALHASDLFAGASGWGLANLKMFLQTQDELYLDQAVRAAKRLLETRRSDDGSGTVYWPQGPRRQYGLAHGSSGAALFLLYLYLATGDSVFLDVGRAALEYEISKTFKTRDGGRGLSRFEGQNYVKYPYWRYGSAGLGCVIVRYLAALHDPAHREVLDGIVLDADTKYASFCGFFIGLAGIGQFFQDAQRILGEPRFGVAARHVADGVNLFQIRRPGGIAFPGDGGFRISCDFATGGAGVAVVLDGLMAPTKEAPFMLDELLPGRRSLELSGVG